MVDASSICGSFVLNEQSTPSLILCDIVNSPCLPKGSDTLDRRFGRCVVAAPQLRCFVAEREEQGDRALIR